jgi:hypothetical protein
LENTSFIYPLFAFVLVLLSLALIPREHYRVYLPVIFIGTLIHALLLYISINLIEAWQYENADPFAVFGIPVFILIAWGAAFALFLWGLPEKLPRWTHYVYIASFAFSGTLIDSTFHSLGLRQYSSWFSAWMWFFPLYFIFWITYMIYLKRKELEVTSI